MVNWVLPIWDSFINLSAKGDEFQSANKIKNNSISRGHQGYTCKAYHYTCNH
ncbi:hypothetical protein EZS27_026304 [termite gut metagenome]|uniref:Uncharacterized protein n=1 Tax=termite gut metagenome TaxID=433724 RepID=A0A5J4QT30_9ZZZZ